MYRYLINESVFALGLPTLEYRGRRTDIIEVYRIHRGIDKVDKNKLFPKIQNLQHNTRGHNQKILQKHCYTNVRENTFSQRIVDDWNRLPEDFIVCKTVNSFKRNLNQVWKHLPVKFEAECYEPEPQSVRTEIYENGSKRLAPR